MLLILVIEASAQCGVRANLAIGHSHMSGMNSVSSQGFGAFEHAVEHHVAIRRFEASVDVNCNLYESGHLSDKALQSCLDALFYCSFLFGREFVTKFPENNVSYHSFLLFFVVISL